MHLADIKEGYNLRLLPFYGESQAIAEINFDLGGYLIYANKNGLFYFIDSTHCICFHPKKLGSYEKAYAADFVRCYHSSVEFLNLGSMNIINEKGIDLEIRAYLGSGRGVRFDVLHKVEKVLKYPRNKQDTYSKPMIEKPICNIVNGKVHYHEFPRMGEIDFHAVIKALKDNGYEGYVTVDLYNHSDVWESVLLEIRKYLLSCMEAASAIGALDVEKEGWNTEVLGEVDHRLVNAPYIRLSHYSKGDRGDYVFLFDLRFTQPNKNYMETKVLHSLEHLLLAGFRKYLDGFVSVAPMGCQTGFYLITLNSCNAYKITATLKRY